MALEAIERADEIPLILYWLLQMQVHTIVDRVCPRPHTNRHGLSYGQLAVLFIAYVVHLRTHRLCGMEDWVMKHHMILEQATGWRIGPKDATDDRVGDLLTVVGEDVERACTLQRELGQHLIQAYALPTDVGRFDTTTFTVYHRPEADGTAAGGTLSRGHSKDHRPDLLQFKQGLATLDPAGVPLLTQTVAGKSADDPLYLPAWRDMCHILGHTRFLYVADCKAAALATRAEVDAGNGFYLFPLPMTGKVPERLRDWVLNPPVSVESLTLPGVTDEAGQPVVIGRGFAVECPMTATLENGQTHRWTERWLVTCSDALARRHQKTLQAHLDKAEAELAVLNTKEGIGLAEMQAQAESILRRRSVTDLITLQLQETVTTQQRCVGPGRPGPNRPIQEVEIRRTQLTYHRNSAAIEEQRQLAGWRIHVTNTPLHQMSLQQAIEYYRDEFLVERGFHRFKRGSLPTLPLFVRLPEHITGLMLLLMIALQLLTLLEFVAHRELAQRQETIAGLEPSNPKMETDSPSAERLLAQFDGLHFVVEQTETHRIGKIFESLTPVQQHILSLLDVPESVYRIGFRVPVRNCFDSS
jgi:transposase